METLRGDFEKKMGIMGKEKIQMIARLGRAKSLTVSYLLKYI